MHFVCISNTFFFKIIPVLVTARCADFVTSVKFIRCVFVNIHVCESLIKKILTLLRFLISDFYLFCCEFVQILRGPANRKSPSTVLTTHGNTGHRISIVTESKLIPLLQFVVVIAR